MADQNKSPEHKNIGRASTIWDTVILPNTDLILQWCEEGLIDNAICASLKISRATWYTALKEHSDFSDSVTRAKHIPNKQVTSALLERCLGIEYDETTKEPLINAILASLKHEARESVEAMIEKLPAAVRDALVTTKVVKKFIPADVQAMKFWLMNREREDWAKSGDEFSGNITVNLPGMYGEKGDIPPPTDGKELAGTAGPEDSSE